VSLFNWIPGLPSLPRTQSGAGHDPGNPARGWNAE